MKSSINLKSIIYLHTHFAIFFFLIILSFFISFFFFLSNFLHWKKSVYFILSFYPFTSLFLFFSYPSYLFIFFFFLLFISFIPRSTTLTFGTYIFFLSLYLSLFISLAFARKNLKSKVDWIELTGKELSFFLDNPLKKF